MQQEKEIQYYEFVELLRYCEFCGRKLRKDRFYSRPIHNSCNDKVIAYWLAEKEKGINIGDSWRRYDVEDGKRIN